MKKNLKVVLWVGTILTLLLAIIFPKAGWAYLVETVLALAILGILTFNVKEKNNALKVILIAFLGLMVLTWIIPAAYYSSEYVEQGRVQMGLFDMFNYPLTALSYFGFITLFIILVGAFYGVLYKIPAYRTFLDKIVTTKKGKYAFITSSYSLIVVGSLAVFALTPVSAWILLPVLVILLVLAVAQFVIKTEEGANKLLLSYLILIVALLVSVCGVQIGIALFIPLIVAIVLMMGYDRITAALVTVGGVVAGLIGTTYANGNVTMLVQTLNLKLNYNIWVRVVILLAAIAIVIFNTIMHVKKLDGKESKVKKAVKKSNSKAAKKVEEVVVAVKNDELVPAVVKKEHSTWPFIVMFVLLFVVFVLAFISWDAEGIGVKAFTNATSSVTKFELFKFPIFGKILGTVNAFGAWTVTDMFVPLLLMVVVLALIYKVSFEDVLDGITSGAKKALAPAAVSVLIYSVLVLVTYHPFQMVIYNTLLGMTKGFNVLTTTVIALIASIFNADMSYTFQSVLPYYVTKVTNLKDFSIVGIIFTSMYGLTMLVAPTSLVLMGTLSYLKVSYKDWLKNIWQLLLELFIVLLIVFIIIAAI